MEQHKNSNNKMKKMSQQKIRVLILDDISDHLNTIKDFIPSTYQVSGKNWIVEFEAIEIIVVGQNGSFSFDMSCIQAIEEVSYQPFDLLLLDIGYRHKDLKIEYLQTIYDKNPLGFNSNTWKDYGALSPDDFIKVKVSDNSKFRKHFLEHKNSIFGYTYIPSGREHLFYDEEGCLEILSKAFPIAAENNKIKMEGTRKKLFNNFPEFEGINEKKFYPYILAKYIEKLIHIEIMKKEVNNAKYLKIKRSSITAGMLIIICGIIGACSEFIGSLVLNLFEKKDFLLAILCIIGFFGSVITIGALIVQIYKKKLYDLFIDDNSTND